MIFMVYCDLEGCEKTSHCYTVGIPNPDRSFCKECGHATEPIVLTYDFCSPEHALEWLKKHIQSSASTVREEK